MLNTKIELLYITPFFPPIDKGGVAHYSYLFLEELSRYKNIHINHLCKKMDIEPIRNVIHYPIIELKLISLINLFNHKNVKKSKIIQIELPCENKYFFYYLFLLTFYRYILKKLIIVRLHEFSERPFFKKIVLYFFVLISKLTICNSNEDILVLNKYGVKIEKIKFVPIYSNIKKKPVLNKNVKMTDIKKNNLIIGYFGQISEKHDHKGGRFIIEILNALINKYKFEKFIFIKIGGDDNSDIIFNKILSLYSDKLLFTGYLDNDQISEYLSYTDVMIFPFKYGFKGKRGSVIASILHEKCLITTYNRFEKYPKSINECICFVSLDVDDFCKKIIEMNEDRNIISKYENNVKKIKEYYERSSIVKKFYIIYNEFIKKQ